MSNPLTDDVYATWAAEVRGWLRRHAPAAEVDDLHQEVFLRIHEGLPRLRDKDRVVPWVWRIVRSVLVDHWRARHPTEPLPDDLATDPPAPDLAPEVAAWLPGMLDALPEDYAAALRRVELEGASQKQLAAELSLSPSGARTRVQRGRKLLREALEACCQVVREGPRIVEVTPRDCC